MSSSLKLPPNPNIPYGLCNCGCGRKTELAKITQVNRHQIKGEPLRFIYGHQARKTPEPPLGYKHCIGPCDSIKPHSEYYRCNNSKDSLQGRCKICSKLLHDQWKTNNPGKIQEHVANGRRRKEFGIEPSQYYELLEKQNGVCAICGEKNQRKNKDGSHYALTVDHDHITGEIRGLLCNLCNPLLGYARDSIELLESAIAYLKKHEQ